MADSVKKPEIIIADNQYLIVDSLTHLIESENKYKISGIAVNRKGLVNMLGSAKPGIVITDIILFDYYDIDDFKSIISSQSQCNALILTNQLAPIELKKIIKAGFRNISLKTDDKQELITAIEMAVTGKKYFCEQVLDMILEQDESKNAPGEISTLTSSEIEIIKLIADSFTTKEIAEKKHISVHTVMTHRKNIFRKLEITSISELTRFAIRNGLIDIIEYNI